MVGTAFGVRKTNVQLCQDRAAQEGQEPRTYGSGQKLTCGSVRGDPAPLFVTDYTPVSASKIGADLTAGRLKILTTLGLKFSIDGPGFTRKIALIHTANLRSRFGKIAG
jgi:hypothetical protein